MAVRTLGLAEMKARGERIVAVTAYDHAMARLVTEAGIPVVLVGDSLGMVMLGYQTTVRVTMEEVLHHTRAVVRGAPGALVVADLPFLTYQVNADEAVRNAGRLVQEGGAQAVKLEGGAEVASTVRRMVGAGIPVMGHLGLTPQSVHALGGFKVQGRSLEQARRLLADAIALEEAGAFAVVLEAVPAELASLVSRRLTIPTIGIGAGAGCDGQIQVLHDVLGLTPRHPRHARRYAELGDAVLAALKTYAAEVASGAFPTPEHTWALEPEVLAALEAEQDGEG